MSLDEEILGGDLLLRHRSPRRGRRAKLNVRMGGRKGRGRIRMAVFILVPTVMAAACALIWLAAHTAVRALFSRNEAFTLTRLEIGEGGVVLQDFIKGKKKIREGVNLFSFSARELREEFLRDAPSFKSLEIRRHLPGTLVVDAIERSPLARIGRRGHFVVDGEGFVFSLGGRKRHLPEITGYRGPKLKPAARLQGLARDAVTLLDVCRQSGIGAEVVLTSVDVSGGFGARENAVRLTLDQGTTVLFWWRRRRGRGDAPCPDLQNRLLYLRGVLRRAREQGGRPPRLVNLTLDTYKSNIPAEF